MRFPDINDGKWVEGFSVFYIVVDIFDLLHYKLPVLQSMLLCIIGTFQEQHDYIELLARDEAKRVVIYSVDWIDMFAAIILHIVLRCYIIMNKLIAIDETRCLIKMYLFCIDKSM